MSAEALLEQQELTLHFQVVFGPRWSLCDQRDRMQTWQEKVDSNATTLDPRDNRSIVSSN